MPIRQE